MFYKFQQELGVDCTGFYRVMFYPKLYIHQMYTLGNMCSGKWLVFYWKVFWFWFIHAQVHHCQKCRNLCFKSFNNSNFSGGSCPWTTPSFSTPVPQSDFSLVPHPILDVLLLSLITFTVLLMNQWREILCLRLLNWYICDSNVFSTVSFVNFDFSLIIFVGTLPISCRYNGLKISLDSPPLFSNCWLGDWLT